MQVGREDLNKGLIRRAERALLVAMAKERPAAGCGYEPSELVGECGLANARLADEHDQRAVTLCRRFEHRLQLAELALTADEGLPLGRAARSQHFLGWLIRSRRVRVRSHGQCRAL